jgi:hypothetical protein
LSGTLAPRTPTAGSPDSPWPNTPTNAERTASSPYRPGGRGGEVGRGLEGAEERAWFGGVKRTPLDRLRHREQVNLRRDRHGTRCSIASTGVLSLRACRPTTRPGSVSRWSGCRYGSGPGRPNSHPCPNVAPRLSARCRWPSVSMPSARTCAPTIRSTGSVGRCSLPTWSVRAACRSNRQRHGVDQSPQEDLDVRSAPLGNRSPEPESSTELDVCSAPLSKQPGVPAAPAEVDVRRTARWPDREIGDCATLGR